ncbi:DUF5004 domain-containing protein [Bacteroides sp. OttesenSCG-928-D19]|nr:DUF5004 domain-containing protein [Bacteroides sp. OttesenSCG-928-N06]MDL2305445.1 DUF5004 domain-containing protein [Bacteroides sp. OttesenSCG-928-D19]
MKKTTKLIVFLLLACMFPFIGCNDTNDGSYVEPITLYEKVNGSWSLTGIVQIDETAKVSGIKPDEISLYDQFGFDSFSLSLNVDAQNRPTSYQVSGTAPELFSNSGYWDLDTEFPYASGAAPTINLYSDAGKTTLVGQLSIVSIPGATPAMELKLTRSSAGVVFVSYNYQLSKNLSIK